MLNTPVVKHRRTLSTILSSTRRSLPPTAAPNASTCTVYSYQATQNCRQMILSIVFLSFTSSPASRFRQQLLSGSSPARSYFPTDFSVAPFSLSHRLLRKPHALLCALVHKVREKLPDFVDRLGRRVRAVLRHNASLGYGMNGHAHSLLQVFVHLARVRNEAQLGERS